MTTLAPAIGRDARDTTSARTLLGVFAAALLVPVLAFAGLAVPLPSSVVRLAADLAERAEALAVGFGSGPGEATGPATKIELRTTVVTAGRSATPRASATRPVVAASPRARRRAAAVLPGGRASSPPRTAGTPRPGRSVAPKAAPVAPATPDTSTPAAQPSGAAPQAPVDTKAPPAPRTDPVPSSSPPTLGDTAEDTVGTLTETVEETVGTVQGTVEETVEETVGTVEETVGDVEQTVEEVVETLPLPLPKPPQVPPLLP